MALFAGEETQTCELRFVKREQPVRLLEGGLVAAEQPVSRSILQQKFLIVHFASGAPYQVEEWRDVPMIEEPANASG